MEVNISPAIANPNPLSSTRFVPINFNHSLSVKLDNKNFLIWKQQIVSMIRGYGLQKFVFSDDEVLVQFLTREDLAKIKVCVYSLAFVGVSLSTKDHVESILDGLPSDYESFVTSVTLRNDDFSKNNNSLDSSPSAHVASFNPIEKGNRSHLGYNGGFGLGGDFGRRGGFNGSRGFNWNDNGRSNRGGFRGRGNKGAFQARLLGTLTIRMKNQYANYVPQNLSGRNPYPQANYNFSPQVNGVIPTPEVFGDDNWYPDFGASNHVTPNPTNLMKSAEFAGQNQVHVGNGTASPPILSPTMLPAPTSPTSLARPISEIDNVVSTHPHAPNSIDTTLAPVQVPSFIVSPQQVVSNPIVTPVTKRIAKDADNTHPMITRAKSGIVNPKIFITAVREPSSVATALQQDEWKEAMVSLVPLPVGRQAVSYKWVYKTKENPYGTVQKYKARLVAKGFHQQAGFDFTETFSPVVKPSTIRVVFTIALSRNWAIKQLDVNNVFLKGDLQEEVFMQQPQGFIDEQNPNLVCRLHKALYGLKQAPQAWFEKLHQVLLSFGFVSAKSDQSLFLRFTLSHITYFLVYVDDILITGSDTTAITSLIAQLNLEFSLKDLEEVHYFLGIQNPLPNGLKLRVGDGDPMEDLHGYRSTVGALQYVTITRPKLSFNVNKVCQFMQNPTEEHWKAASDLDDRRLTSGHCVFLGPNLISWQSKKQHTVSRSSLVAEITWLRSLLSELQLLRAKPPLVWCDNLSTVLLSANPVLHARTKQIEFDLYFVREKIIRKEIEVCHIVSSTQFIEFRHKLRIENLSTLSLRGC
ncbi:hypothetical protein AAG906_004187 [Vitis piasezkii]